MHSANAPRAPSHNRNKYRTRALHPFKTSLSSWKLVFCVCIFLNVVYSTNAFFYSRPRYHQTIPRRAYRQPRRRHYYGEPQGRRGYRNQQPEQSRQREIIKDLDQKIELYIPCGRYCRYYEARLLPNEIAQSRNLPTIKVTGPRYSNSWEIPRNVDIDGITKAIVHGTYLKLEFPKIQARATNGNDERAPPPHHYSMHNEQQRHTEYSKDGAKETYVNNHYETEPHIGKHRHGDHVEARRSKYNDYYRDQKRQYNYDRQNSESKDETITKSNRDYSPSTSPNPLQEEHDPYFYEASEGIEIIDIDSSEIENQLYQKDKKASIGFWNSRGKFQFY